MNKSLVTLTLAALVASSAASVQAKQYVFPQKGQSSEQQAQDEYTCHSWAVGETGYDPSKPQPVEVASTTTTAQEPVKQGAETGSGLRGALGGAAAGAIVGEITDNDTSDAAAAGAAVGMIHGRRSSRRDNAQQAQQQQQAQAQAQAEAQAQQQQQAAATNAQVTEYYKAKAVCLEAKGYSVK